MSELRLAVVSAAPGETAPPPPAMLLYRGDALLCRNGDRILQPPGAETIVSMTTNMAMAAMQQLLTSKTGMGQNRTISWYKHHAC